MNSVKKLEGSKFEVTIVKSGAEVVSMREHVLTHFKDAKVDGFRQGKVPMDIIEKTYKAQIDEEIIDHVISAEYPGIIKENNIVPVDYFKLTKVEITKENLEVVFEVPVLPEIKLGEYKGLKIKKEKANVTDETVNQEIEKLLASSGKLKELEDAKAKAALEDVVNINFEGFVDGEAFEGGKAEGFDLTLGTGSFIDTFEDQIVGHKKDDEFDVNVNFPEAYHSDSLAGKPALFKVKVNSIKRPEKVELNDEFAKEQSYDTVADMTAKIKENLVKKEDSRVENEFISKLVEKVVETSEIDVPAAMVDREIDRKLQEFSQQLQMQGFTLEKYFEMTGQSIEAMRESVQESAANAVKTDLVLGEIAKVENITAEDSEVEPKIEEMAKAYGMEKDAIIADVKKAGNYDVFIDNIKYQIINEKTIDLLKKSAK